MGENAQYDEEAAVDQESKVDTVEVEEETKIDDNNTEEEMQQPKSSS